MLAFLRPTGVRTCPLHVPAATSAIVCVLLVCLGSHATAQLPAARLFTVFPPGAQQGTTVEVTIGGADLEGVHRLHFSHPGITAVQKTQTPEGAEEPVPVVNQFVVTVAADVPLGHYECRAIGTYGISNPRAFTVDQHQQVNEVEPNNQPEQAMSLEIGSVVNGRADAARDVDYYRFSAVAGQRVLIDCHAERIDSRMDATLEVLDAKGHTLEFSRDVYRRDPFVDFMVPADGQYVIKVHDFVYAGSAEHYYRLAVSTAPHVETVFPPSAQPNTVGTFTLYGRNLPGGSPTGDVTLDGKPLEQLEVEIAAPQDDSAPQRFDFATLAAPRDAALDAFRYRLHSPQGASNGINLWFAQVPVVVEQEPNDEPVASQKIDVPCEVVGRFGEAGDQDWFRFAAAKGQAYWIEVISERLGLPTDPYYIIERVVVDENGNETATTVTEQDDLTTNLGGPGFPTNSRDAGYRFVAPEEGTYRIGVRDLYYENRGNPRMVYRLVIRAEQPDFRLVALSEYPITPAQTPNPWTALVRKGGTARITVLAFRQDGLGGEIHLDVEGLPEGVTTAGAVIGPGQTRTDLILTADEAATDWAGTIRITGRAQHGEAELVREARYAAVTWPLQGLASPARLARDFAVGVAETAPYRVACGIDRITLPQSRQLHIPLTATRRGDFDKPLNVTGAALPGNVQNEAVTLAPDQSEGILRLFVPQDAPTGTFTFYAQVTAPVPFTKNADGSDKKDVNTVEASTPVTVTITPGPLVLAPNVPGNGVIKRGGQIEVPVKVTRRNNFAGPVTLDLLLPSGVSGVTAEPVTLAADAEDAKLVLSASAEATEGNHAHVAIRARAGEGDDAVEVHQNIPLNVQP